MSKQNIQNIPVKDLRLWSENPRDPVDVRSTDAEIIKRAIDENPKKWNLERLKKEMGDHYDFSEIPTVVYMEGVPVVYDGNRRIAILKYLQDQKLRSSITGEIFSATLVPTELEELDVIPCNVCDLETALTNVERKHINSGSWGPLERDYFLCMHRGQPETLFVKFEEQTGGGISGNDKMNQRFVKEEVLTKSNLSKIGFHFDQKKGIVSSYTKLQAERILDGITSLVNNQKIDTRGDSRGKIKEPLIAEFPALKSVIHPYDKSKKHTKLNVRSATEGETGKEPQRKTPRQNKNNLCFFSESLSLKSGQTNDLYRDIVALHDYYEKNKSKLSSTFPGLIRMSLRLIVESATPAGKKIDDYIKQHFTKAKRALSKDHKTALSTHSITEKKLCELLHIGAHNYSSASNMEQTVAMSLIIGQMLKISHGKKSSRS